MSEEMVSGIMPAEMSLMIVPVTTTKARIHRILIINQILAKMLETTSRKI